MLALGWKQIMETNSSISFAMPNLLIGLCKGARSLKEYSMVFHDQLGYNFFRLELSFQLSIGRNINPDAIVISTKLGTTLLFEWTETNDPGQKHDQLNRYAKVQSSDIIDIAAVPPTAVKTFDVALTLRPNAINNFQSHLANNSCPFPILVFDQQDQTILLSKAANSFQDTLTDSFFVVGIRTDRLPRYLPFSLETCQPKELVPFIVQHLVSMLVKGETIISLPDFCKGFIPAWGLIGIEKQRELSKVVKALINDLLRQKWGGQLAKRNGDNPPTWVLLPDMFKKNPRGVRKQLNDFIAEVQGETYQPGFDFGSEI
jgi:hypothetical protein